MAIMKKIFAMKYILLLDALLLALCLGLGSHLRRQWIDTANQYQLSKIVAPSEAIKNILAKQRSSEELQKNYAVIASRNLFSPDRNDTIASVEQEKPRPPKPILYGILNLKETRLAMMSPPDKQDFVSLKAGDKIGEYTLSKILINSVELKWGKETVTATTEEQPKSVQAAAMPPVTNGGTGGRVVTVESTGGASTQVAPGATLNPTGQPNQAPGANKGRIINTPFGPKRVED
jgi:hypothetical protein